MSTIAHAIQKNWCWLKHKFYSIRKNQPGPNKRGPFYFSGSYSTAAKPSPNIQRVDGAYVAVQEDDGEPNGNNRRNSRECERNDADLLCFWVALFKIFYPRPETKRRQKDAK